jgi:gluconolactonase
MRQNSKLKTMALQLTPSFEVIDPRFRSLTFPNVHVEKLHTGCRWAEGPAWFAAGRYLVWSDIPNDRMLRWDECDGSTSTFRASAGYTNGHTVDRQGRLVSCEHLARRVTRTEVDGTITVLADRYQGRRLNSPNDVVVRSDGSVWFTDPSYGIDHDYEGLRQERELDGCHVYRIDPDTAEVSRVAEDFARPNGLAFSPDESRLYIADTGATHDPDGPRHIRAFDVIDDRTLSGGEVFAVCGAGIFDGFRFDEDGRLWTSAGDGVHCFESDGTLIGKIRVPETVSNVCFGGPHRNRLFITATTSLYAVYLLLRGAKTF